jgi:hypothetical protein
MRWIIMTGAALLGLGGCGAGGSDAPEAPPGEAAGTPRGSLTSPDGRSEVRAGDAALSGLPEGIPPYPRPGPGGAIQFGGNSDGNEMRVMGFQTADPPAEVIAFYAAAGERAGFREIHRAVSGPSHVLGLDRADGVLNVTATGAPGGTRVQLMAGAR